MKIVFALVVLALISSCSHPLEIYGQGDILSSSGNRDCTLEAFQAGDPECSENYVIGAYQETYTAVPRTDWVFKGWRTLCDYSNVDNTCSLFIPQSVIVANWGKVGTPLRAEFIPDCTGIPGCFEALPPQLGAVTDSSIKVWQTTRSEVEFQLHYRLAGAPSWTVETVDIDASTDWVGTIHLTGLLPDTLYEYESWLDGTFYQASTFSTLPAASYTGELRFGFGTDFSSVLHPFSTLGFAASRNYHFMLMIGDLMYSDQPLLVANTADAYSERYWLTWNEPNFAALGLSTPLFMMWDDHELLDDFYPGLLRAGEVVSRYPAAREAYDRYMGSHNPDTGSEIYYSFSTPGADFFVLDTRSYRSPNTAVDDAQKTMLGQVQRDALLDYLELSSAPFKFIVTSVPFALGQVSTDTWHSYQTERALILSEIEQRGISGVAFLSGDRHWSGAFRFTSSGGHDYYEFLPSPSGAVVKTGSAPPVGNNGNETVIFSADALPTVGDFVLDLSGTTPSLRAAFVDDTGSELCAITIASDQTGVVSGGALENCE